MNHADPNTMRARARQAIEILKTQLIETGTIEPLVALYFDDHIEQAKFEDSSVLEHFDVRTARTFDYLRTMVGIKKPQAAMITLDVRMGPFESDQRDVLADSTAIFLMLDSPFYRFRFFCPTHVVAGVSPCQMFTTRRCPVTMAVRRARFSRFSRMYLWPCAERAHRLPIR